MSTHSAFAQKLAKIPHQTICLCGSLKFTPEIKRIAKQLEKIGKNILVPQSILRLDEDTLVNESYDKIQQKKDHDAIRAHFNKITQSDAVLLCNYTKNDITHYIGANTFLELGFAHHHEKPIYSINPLPNMPYINDEILALNIIPLD